MTPIPTFSPVDFVSLANEMLSAVVVVLVIATAAISAVSAQIARFARRKGRAFGSFYWVGMLLSPIAAGTIVATVAPMTHMKMRVACPACEEHVSANSSRCGHCAQTLTPSKGVATAIAREFRATTRNILGWGFGFAGFGIVLLITFAQSLKDSPNAGVLSFGILFLCAGAASLAAIPSRYSTADEIERTEVTD